MKNKKVLFLGFFAALALQVEHSAIAENSSNASFEKEQGNFIREKLRQQKELNIFANNIEKPEELVGLNRDQARNYFFNMATKACSQCPKLTEISTKFIIRNPNLARLWRKAELNHPNRILCEIGESNPDILDKAAAVVHSANNELNQANKPNWLLDYNYDGKIMDKWTAKETKENEWHKFTFYRP